VVPREVRQKCVELKQIVKKKLVAIKMKGKFISVIHKRHEITHAGQGLYSVEFGRLGEGREG
jgi:hypothetical protein